MKRFLPLLAACCLLFAGCSGSKAPVEPRKTKEGQTPPVSAPEKPERAPEPESETQPVSAEDMKAPKGYRFLKGIRGDFDCDGTEEVAGLFQREKESYNKEKPRYFLIVETKDGETLMKTGDIVTPDAELFVRPVTRRDYRELLAVDYHGGKENFYAVMVYGWKKYKGEPVFGTLFRVTGAVKEGDSVLLNADNNLVTVFSAAEDGDILAGEATRFAARELYWKSGTLVVKKEAVTKKKYGGGGRDPNGFYAELGYDEPFMLTKKTFEENARQEKNKEDKKSVFDFLHK
ncbi:MAG: hypothetical protein ILO36_04120 [Abditibacteriota bacterium]|nr:hypothetical protein [Abditibacteriota bacterium]